MALYGDCTLLEIIIRSIGVIKLRIGGCLVSMNFMMSLYGIIITVMAYDSGLMIEGICSMYHCLLTHFLSVIVVTLTQSRRIFQQSLCSFFKPRVVSMATLTIFSLEASQSPVFLGHLNINIGLCGFFIDISFISALYQRDVCVITIVAVKKY
jgi:hypothetical protein